jgi:uncharacterized protein with FMN-binding domain
MRRAPIVLSATAAGLAGVLAFHSHRPASRVAVVPPTTSPATTSPPQEGTSNPPATTTPPEEGASNPAPTTSTPTTAPKVTPSGTRSASGNVTQYRYGELSVTVTESNGHITDLEMASLNETDSRSVAIDDQAIPQLRQEVLTAQSANIDGVSGATFTSEAYATSVQSALDQLGIK